MKRITIHLPKYRLEARLVKRRGEADESIFPKLSELGSLRAGNRVSRFFRHVFEHKRIKHFLGRNLALTVVAATLLPTHSTGALSALSSETVEVIAAAETPMKTVVGIRYPVDEIKITQGYTFYHPALDLDGITGDPIYPILAGKVVSVDHSRFAYGNSVIVSHGGTLESLYAHLSKVEVEKGQEVDTGTKLGEMGATGHAFGDHLHLEIREDARAINPYSVLPRAGK